MFKKKKTEDLTCEEIKQVAKLTVDSGSVMTAVSEAIQRTIDDDQMKLWIEDRIKDQFNESSLKAKVHTVMNSNPMSEIIYELLKDRITTIINNTPLIDEIVHERVDAAGIEQVIQWNNIAYGLLLERVNAAESKFAPYDEIKQQINKCRRDIHDLDGKMYRPFG